MKYIIFLILSFPFTSYAQDIVDVDMTKYCKEELELDVVDFKCDSVPSFELKKVDDSGKEWKLRFHFGYSDTDYHKTDLHVKSSDLTVTVKDVEIVQRTSNHHYNPKNWGHITDSLKWIDEPTNTFTFSLEKGKNNFYLTIFHPKYIKSILYKETVVDGVKQYDFKDVGEAMDFSQTIPEGYNMMYLGNTHMNMIWQLGYGRKLTLFESKKSGKLSYIPKADLGISTGAARSVRIVPGVAWDDYTDDMKVQGFNASIGHRLEYQYGKVSMFVDHKAIYTRTEHGFYDGTVKYDLISTPLTFGLGIDLFSSSRSKKKKKTTY